jgi:translation elongation factor EF-G
MELLEKIRNDKILAKKVNILCDFKVYEKNRLPDNANGRMVWNIEGMAFARDASGGEYVLLNDGSIAFNSSEGETGRIAENFTEMLELLVNCSCWMDYLYFELYENEEMLEKYTQKAETDNEKSFNKLNDEFQYQQLKQELIKDLSIQYYDDIKPLMQKFYAVAKRAPQYIYVWKEDGVETKSSGCIIERELYMWVKERMGL